MGISTGQWAVAVPFGWKGNRGWPGVVSAMHHRIAMSTYGLIVRLRKGNHFAYTPVKSKKCFPYSLRSVWPGADPGVQAVSPQVSHPPGGRLPLLFVRPAVTFPAAEHHRPLAGTKLYCLVTEAHRCEQLVQGCYAAFAQSRIWTHDLLIASPTLSLPVAPPRHL